METKKRILIIDALNAFVRAYSADPSTTPQQIPVGGVRGFLKILQKMVRITAPDRVFICWDGEGGSKKRKRAFKDYKQGRNPLTLNSQIKANAEDELKNRIWQETRLVEYLNTLPLNQLMVEGVEADDLIGFLCNDIKFHTYQKVIVSNDKDFIQLCNDRTILYRPVKEQILTTKSILEEYAIHPVNFVLARAMCGDTSDNLPGVKGAGLATIAKRFPFLKEEREYSLDDILKTSRQNLHEQKIYKAVLQDKEKIKLNHKVMQLQYRLVTGDQKKEIFKGIKGSECILNKPTFAKLASEDGLMDINFEDLFHYMEKIVIDNCPDKK
jgi:DNA polymerase-1